MIALVVVGGQDHESVKGSICVRDRFELRLPESPGESGEDCDFLFEMHLQLADQSNGNDEDGYLGRSIENGDNHPSGLTMAVSLICRDREGTPTFPLQEAVSDESHKCSGPQSTDTAIAAPMPQAIRVAIAM